jgi:carboxymethylenebutenolidase
MGQTRKIPAEAVELYTRFIHGEISRRDFFNEVQRFAVAGLTGTAIIEALMPNYALGQQVPKDDERIKASYETLPSPSGNGYIRGYFVRPFSADSRDATPAKVPGIIVIHENRGLNPHTEDVARRFALENFMAFAPDALTSVGGLSGRRLQGRRAIWQDRRRQEDPGFRRRRAVVEIASGLHRKNRRNRLLLWRRHGNTLAVLLGPDLAAAAPFCSRCF